MCMYVSVCVHACVCVCVYACAYVCVCMGIFMHVCMHVHVHKVYLVYMSVDDSSYMHVSTLYATQ